MRGALRLLHLHSVLSWFLPSQGHSVLAWFGVSLQTISSRSTPSSPIAFHSARRELPSPFEMNFSFLVFQS